MSSLFQMKRATLVVFSLFLLLTSALWAQFPQGFEEGAIPTTWTVYNVDGDAKQFVAFNAGAAAQEGAWVAQCGYNAAGNNDWLVTPQIAVTNDNKVFKFWARSTSTTWFEDFNIKLSTTGNAVDNFTVNITSVTDLPNEWTMFTVDLTAYVGTSVYVGIQLVSVDELTFRVDGFDWVLGNDLAALSVTGPNTPTVGTANPYIVNVKNNGGNAQSTYTVKFFVNDTEVAALPGTQIAAGATAPFTFTWTPAAVQTYTLYGKVEMTGDMNAANDQTPNLSVVVQPSGTVAVTVGDPNSSTSSNSYPANFYWKNSLSQCLYMADEINAGGAITSIKYYATLLGDIPADKPLKVWMANTTTTAFSGTSDWLPLDQFTLVFDGTVNLTSIGAYDLTLPLQVPFIYGGGNLVVMVSRPMDDAYYGSGNVWKNTATANYPNRTIYFNSDSTIADPAAPPSGTLAGNVPNTTFTLNTAGFATLNGVVTSNGVPVAGARVAIDGTTRFGLTNAQGQYEIAYVNPGTVNLTTTKHGYITQNTTGVSLTADQTTTRNIVLTQYPVVFVTGQILGSDTGIGMSDATVKLEGYENYEVLTNASGAFSFTGVYANQTYTLKASKPGYQAYNSQVVVGPNNLVVPAITLNELANPPSGVVATATPTQVNLTWNAPGDGVDVWFTHALMEPYTDAIGTGAAAEFIVAHRYSQAQLQTFGVSGATLTKVKFMPAVAEAAYTIKIYTGGSATDAGTLVHEQVVPTVTIQEWNEVELTNSVSIPTTGELWIGYNVNTPTGYPAGCDEGPQLEGYGNMMYWQGTWTTLATLASSLTYNWMIKGLAQGATGPTTFAITEEAPVAPRAFAPARKELNATLWSKGSVNGVTSSARNSYQESAPVITLPSDRAITGYNIWRTPLATMNQEITWTQLATGVTVTNYTDPTWAQLTTGQYKYVVKAVYTGGVLSNPAFSNTVSKNMTCNVTINLATADGQSPAGAVVTLTNTDGNPEHVYTATATSATVNFPAVWHGTYTVNVVKTGYQAVIQNNVNIAGQTYNHPVITLPVSNIFWAEGFEGATFPPTGWTMIDADGDSYNWAVFTNEGTNVYAYEGQICAKSDSYINNVGALTPDNWLITNQLNLPAGFDYTLTYWVAAQDPAWAAEQYSVMVSTTNAQPASFTAVFNETLASGSYEQRTINLNNYAGQNIYLAFRHHNVTDMFAMKIDNIEINRNGSPVVNHFVPVWTGNGLQHMNFYIFSPEVDNMPLEYGDEIAVFDGNYCVGSYRITNPSLTYYSLVASLDDPGTTAVDGYTVGHNISYRIWKNSTQTEYSGSQVSANYISGNQTYTIGGSAQVELSAISSITQNINLNTGWNIMSVNTLPSNLTLPSVFSGLVSNSQLIKVQNESGQAFEFLSAIGQWINNIGSIAATEGYYVKVNSNCQLSVNGLPVSLPLSIPLTNGWNIMSYPYQSAQTAMPLLQNLINNNQLIKVMNESGQAIEFLSGIGWINNIQNFVPGEGYSIKVSQNVNFNYPTQRTNDISLANIQMTAKKKLIQPTHFVKNWSGNGYKHHNLYVVANDYLKSLLRSGDEIAVFDGENCVASVAVNGDETYYSLIASMREEDSEAVNGYNAGNNFTLRIYNNSTEYSSVPFEILSGSSVFESGASTLMMIHNLLANDNLMTPKLTEIKSIYPNPFNPTTTIQYSLSKNDRVEIEIYNIKGQKVRTLVSEHQNAGNYQVTWFGKDSNDNSVSSGVYFVRMKTSEKQITHKMMMVK